MTEKPEESKLNKILQKRLKRTLIQIKKIERELPKLEKDYGILTKELETCTDKARINVLKILLREKRWFISQQQKARLDLVKQIELILKMNKEN